MVAWRGMRESVFSPELVSLMQPVACIARPAVRALRASKIREVANAGIGRQDIAAFWFGEPDEVTPSFIRQAAVDALNAGDTFYTHNLGIPELRQAVAAYVTRLHRPTEVEEVAITNSGMSALMLTAQALVGHGDRVVAVTPLWPNLVEIPKILGASVATVALRFTPRGWVLDLERLLQALTAETRVVLINSPNNPTGWTIDRDSQRVILEHCRRHGIWIIADDAYERLYYNNAVVNGGAPAVAPSFLDIATTEDRVISTNTFSKSWLMTGFRLGWIVAPKGLTDDLPKLIEYNTSCAPPFVQRAGIVAIQRGEPVIARTIARLRTARDYLIEQLNAAPGVQAAAPAGAMYAFFRVAGIDDSLALCKRLVSEAALGLAPGIAFGPEGEGFVRWCFAASEERLAEGIRRLRGALDPGAKHR
jgi:aspartate/methionine/tyrosine aminotransferase